MKKPLPSLTIKKIVLTAVILLAFTGSAQKSDKASLDPSATEGPSCRKFEEKLYFSSLLGQAGGQKRSYIDSLKGCMAESPQLHLTLGKYYYNKGDYAEADKEYSKVPDMPAANKTQLAQACFYLGLTSYYTGQNERSLNYSKKALDLGYNPSWCYNSMGLPFYAKNQLEQANSYYKKALEYDPRNDIAANNISCNYNTLFNHYEAYRYCRLADSIVNGSKAAYRSNMMRNLTELQRKKEALALAEDSYKKFPEDENVIEDYAKVLFDQKKFKEALVLGRKLLKRHPDNGWDWFSIGYIYDNAGEIDSAFYFYNICLKYDPNNSSAHGNIGLLYKDIGLFDKAHAKLDLALSLNPGKHYYYEQKQATYMWQHDFENSYLWALKCIEKFPERKGYDFRLGYALQQYKKYNEAIPLFRKALLYEPDDDRLYNNLGRCFAELGQRDSANYYFKRAVKKNPDNSYIYHNRAAFYYDLGKYELACADLKKAIDLEYNWIIDEKLIRMKKTYCPDVNTDIKVLINEYKGNNPELAKYNFIKLSEQSLIRSMDETIIESNKEPDLPKETASLSNGADQFNLFPNPNKGVFSIESSRAVTDPLILKLFDANGRLVLTDKMTDQTKKQVGASDLATGIYVLMILDNTSVLCAKKVIIEH